MAWVVNNSARVIHIGGVVLSPGMPVEIHDDALKNEQVENLFKEHVEGSANMVLKKVEAPQHAPPAYPPQQPQPQHPQGETKPAAPKA